MARENQIAPVSSCMNISYKCLPLPDEKLHLPQLASGWVIQPAELTRCFLPVGQVSACYPNTQWVMSFSQTPALNPICSSPVHSSRPPHTFLNFSRFSPALPTSLGRRDRGERGKSAGLCTRFLN